MLYAKRGQHMAEDTRALAEQAKERARRAWEQWVPLYSEVNRKTGRSVVGSS